MVCPVYCTQPLRPILQVNSVSPTSPTIQRRGLSGAQWSNSKEEWINTEPMTCEENLLKQAQLIKAKNPLGKGQKVWVRRHTVTAPLSPSHTPDRLFRTRARHERGNPRGQGNHELSIDIPHIPMSVATRWPIP